MSDNRYYVKYLAAPVYPKLQLVDHRQWTGVVPSESVLKELGFSRAASGGLDSFLFHQQILEILAKLLQRRQPFWRGVYNFALGLKNLSSLDLREHAHHLAHLPAGSAQDLQAVHARD